MIRGFVKGPLSGKVLHSISHLCRVGGRKNGSARTGVRASYSCRWSDKGENEDACNLQSRSDVNKYLRGYSDIS